MSEPREPLHEGGLKRPDGEPPGGQGLSKTGGGERRGGDDDARGGMIGEGEGRGGEGMADEG